MMKSFEEPTSFVYDILASSYPITFIVIMILLSKLKCSAAFVSNTTNANSFPANSHLPLSLIPTLFLLPNLLLLQNFQANLPLPSSQDTYSLLTFTLATQLLLGTQLDPYASTTTLPTPSNVPDPPTPPFVPSVKSTLPPNTSSNTVLCSMPCRYSCDISSYLSCLLPHAVPSDIHHSCSNGCPHTLPLLAY